VFPNYRDDFSLLDKIKKVFPRIVSPNRPLEEAGLIFKGLSFFLLASQKSRSLETEVARTIGRSLTNGDVIEEIDFGGSARRQQFVS
jgi:hypothetical protein